MCRGDSCVVNYKGRLEVMVALLSALRFLNWLINRLDNVKAEMFVKSVTAD